MNNMWTNATKFRYHVELSNYCNAACPFCPRYDRGTLNIRSSLKLSQITLTQFKDWFSPEILKNITYFTFCGTNGDPLMAKDFSKICQYIIENSNAFISVNTNGGLRDAEYWTNLALILNSVPGRHKIIFGIDGLEDTNHLYRRKVVWNKVIENVKAFINSGGNAVWDFLVFEHNEHQIEEVKRLAKEIKFSDVRIKSALGFEYFGKLVKKGVYDSDGNLEYTISPTTKAEYLNDAHNETLDLTYQPVTKINITEINRQTKPLDNLTDYEWCNNEIIKCRSKHQANEAELFLSANGIISPCCFVGTAADSDAMQLSNVQSRNIINSNRFDLNSYPMSVILEELDEQFAKKWTLSHEEGRPIMCSLTCGTKSKINKIHNKK